MGVVKFLYHPDTVLTAADLESLALDLLSEIPIPGVEGCGFNSGIIRQTLLQAAVDQKWREVAVFVRLIEYVAPISFVFFQKSSQQSGTMGTTEFCSVCWAHQSFSPSIEASDFGGEVLIIEDGITEHAFAMSQLVNGDIP